MNKEELKIKVSAVIVGMMRELLEAAPQVAGNISNEDGLNKLQAIISKAAVRVDRIHPCAGKEQALVNGLAQVCNHTADNFKRLFTSALSVDQRAENAGLIASHGALKIVNIITNNK